MRAMAPGFEYLRGFSFHELSPGVSRVEQEAGRKPAAENRPAAFGTRRLRLQTSCPALPRSVFRSDQ